SVGELLVAPVAETLQDETVYVVTSNVMNTIPFEALVAGGAPLVEKHLVAYTQSASHLLAAIEREAAPGSAAVVFAPEAASPGAARGAAALPQAEFLSGEAATETRLRNLDSGARWVHVAAPADVHHPDVLLNSVKLAADAANDGLVHAAELLVSSLPASLVSLDLDYGRSADRTSGLRLSGLAEGFLQAGVPSIVINLWPVQDEAGAFFLKAFYDNLGAMEKLAAFHAAQVATRAQYPGVAQWAAFTFRGDFR
ncbi:MAG: CHAT domain-containing protein, partial [Candidatus Hydrogenedentes bacterium]|nr:CHAT domain-containing protein [Candidatus Hydrogenedentota bacterium]